MSKSTILTALRSTSGNVATKTHRFVDGKWETTGYTAGKQFDHASKRLTGLDDLGASLEALAGQPQSFVIRGNVMPGVTGPIARTYKQADSRILDVDKSWLCVDIDGCPAKPNRDHIEQALELVPEWLRAADCVWQFSSSHGVKPADQIRLHLWFWLVGAPGNNALRHWARGLAYVDGALYQPVQPHYTASPIFVGCKDPIANRIGYRRSDHRAAWPPAELLPTEAFDTLQKWQAEDRQRERMALEAVRPPTRLTSWDEDKRYRRIVDAELQRIRTTQEGGRHEVIYHAAKAVASLAHASSAAASARADVEAAACAIMPANRQDEARRRVAEGWAAGTANPRDLKQHEDDSEWSMAEAAKPSFLDWRNFR